MRMLSSELSRAVVTSNAALVAVRPVRKAYASGLCAQAAHPMPNTVVARTCLQMGGGRMRFRAHNATT